MLSEGRTHDSRCGTCLVWQVAELADGGESIPPPTAPGLPEGVQENLDSIWYSRRGPNHVCAEVQKERQPLPFFLRPIGAHRCIHWTTSLTMRHISSSTINQGRKTNIIIKAARPTHE